MVGGAAGLTELPPRELEAVFGAGRTAREAESLRQRSFASTVVVWRVLSETGSAVLKLIRLGAAPVARWSSEPPGIAGDLTQIRWAFLRGTALRLLWLDPERARDDRMRKAWRAAVATLDRWCEAARELPSEP